MSPLRSPAGALLLAAAVFASPLAAAPGPFEQTYRDAAKAEANGDVVGALAKFESIPAASRDFLVRLHIASCKRKLARFLESAADLEAIVAEPSVDEATKETAQSDLDDLRTHTPKLFVRLSVGTSGLEVSLDGAALSVPSTRLLNPGAHLVVARRGGREVFRREVVLAEGMSLEVEIDVPSERAPATPPTLATGTRAAPTAVVVAPPPTAPRASDDGSGQRKTGWVFVGIGGVAALGAVGARLGAESQYHQWQTSCRTGPCNDAAQERTRVLDVVTVSSIGLAVVGVGVGAALVLTAPSAPRSVEVRATTGTVTGVEIAGRF